MNCDLKTIMKIGVGLGIVLTAVYFALPASHAFILASAPFLLFLACQIAMIFMMKGMNGATKDESAKVEEGKVNSVMGETGPDKT